MNIDLQDCKTSAQAITKLCYNQPTRNLHFRVQCENLVDLKSCVNTIDSYNDFDAKKINEALSKFVNIREVFPHGNSSEPLKFDIGREGSPVLYVKWIKTGFGSGKYIKNGNESTELDFRSLMTNLASELGADESSSDEDGIFFEHRFWWD